MVALSFQFVFGFGFLGLGSGYVLPLLEGQSWGAFTNKNSSQDATKQVELCGQELPCARTGMLRLWLRVGLRVKIMGLEDMVRVRVSVRASVEVGGMMLFRVRVRVGDIRRRRARARVRVRVGVRSGLELISGLGSG